MNEVAERREINRNKERENTEMRGWLLLVLTLCLTASAAPLTGPHSRVIRGQVIDAYTRRPVAFAALAQAGTLLYADENGRFGLRVESETDSVEVSHVGYTPRRVRMRPSDGSITILLTPQAISLRGVTVSAFRTAVPLSQSGPVSVLEGDALHAKGRLNVGDALLGLTSLGIRDYANMSTMSLRGASAEQTLIMFDGIPLNSSQDNLVDLTGLPLVFSERVEVVRGANSALYGANAIGGLVNILPPSTESIGVRVNAGLGSLGRRHASALHTGRRESFGYALAGGLNRIGPNFTYKDTAGAIQKRINSDVTSASLLAKGTYRRALSFLAAYSESRRGVPGPVSWPSDSARMSDSRAVFYLSHLLRFSDRAQLETKAFHHRFRRSYHDPNPLWPANDTHATAVTGLALKQTSTLTDAVAVIAGVEVNHDGLQSTAIGRPARLAGSGWLQSRAHVGRFAAAPMVRLDLSSSSDARDTNAANTSRAAFSPKLAVTGSPLLWLDLYASAGRSFRQPTFNELYWPQDQWTRGNPLLKPEWASSVDFHAAGRFGAHVNCWLGGWYSHMTDLIQWQPDSNSVFTPVNLDTATITGIEAELGTSFRHGGVTGTITLMDARSRGKELVYRPRYSIAVQHRLELDPVGIYWDVRHVGPRYADAENKDALPGFLLLDAGLSLGRRFGPVSASLRAGARNIFDRQYQVMKGYPVPGRTLYCELETGL